MGVLDTTRFIVNHPLGRRAPLRAFGRFVAWQVASRASPGAIAVPFVQGSRLLVERGMTGATGNVYVGLHDFEEMAFVLHVLRSDGLFLDIGANIGSYTILAAKGIGCSCVSVEPIATTIQKLRDNLALNHVGDRVEVHACAAGETDGLVRMTASGDTTNHVLSSHAIGAVDVPSRTLDGLLGDRSPSLFKMDIEGHELPALRGARQLLSRPTLTACIVETLGADSRGGIARDPVTTLLESHGFQPASYDPWQRRLTRITQLKAGNDTIFVRNWTVVAELLRSAPAFTVLGQTC